MTRQRVRRAYTAEEMPGIYTEPHNHWPARDHQLRVAATIEVGRWLSPAGFAAGADLSCGDGAILNALPVSRRIFGDYAPGYMYTGSIEETIGQIEPVDLFVCCETLEHLDDPDRVLKQIRNKTRYLLLSTPVGAWDDDNWQHYWAWSRADVEDMLRAAGFGVTVYAETDCRPSGMTYSFGIWGAA